MVILELTPVEAALLRESLLSELIKVSDKIDFHGRQKPLVVRYDSLYGLLQRLKRLS